MSEKQAIYRKQKSPRSLAMDRADKYFSQYVRLKDCIVYGDKCYCKDIIGGKYYLITRIDNGHFYSRIFKATRYHEDNCRPQNQSSNRFRGEADKDKFWKHLLEEIGRERMDALFALHLQNGQDSQTYYAEIATTYRKKVNELLKNLGITNPFV